ncbi:MAG: hypothetical protein JRI25_29300 [Deltaproteobacteria bacterium]|nr:hypothetical protein [Deltaproteobacteria bacterium]
MWVESKRRLGFVVAASLAMWFAASPAQAGRNQIRDVDGDLIGPGAFPHLTDWMVFHGFWWGYPQTCEFPTGEWTEWHISWATNTEEQLQDWVDKAIVEVEVDGKPVDFFRETWAEDWAFGEAYLLLQAPLSVGDHTVLLRWTLEEPHFDGWGWNCCDKPLGCCSEGDPSCEYSDPACVWEYGRDLVITPRGDYPSGLYEDCPQ